ncbi:MAG TPA: ABC transporter ATP-binding protein [Acidimicrobiia bacterium]|nr:ABC transporter ATP-binding protein [Acidimicrobiia bacterium]
MAGVVISPGLHLEMTVDRSERFRLALAMAIAPGTTVALLGPNGAGKSTAVAAIAGLVPIESGRITLNGVVLDDPEQDIFLPADERKVGVVFQDYLLFPHTSVLENVAFGLRSRRMPRDQAHTQAREWLERLGLEALESARPGDLSGGQAQRVALARALASEPDLLLLDEPLAALDVTTRTELRHTLAEHLAGFTGPRLLITHDPVEAFLLADEIHVIEDGAVTQHGSADDIRLRPRTPYVADLAGANLIAGTAGAGQVVAGDHTLRIADDQVEGPVLVTIHPTAVSIHAHRPEGSPRNTWLTPIERVELLGPRVRLRTGSPLPLTVELTESARAELALTEGREVWVAIKATEIGVQPDPIHD